MPSYRNLSQLEQAYKVALADVIDSELIPFIVETWLDYQDELVYKAYKPKQYERRGKDGGLADSDNIQVEINDRDKVREYILSNVTEGAFGDNLINDIIEGTGWSYGDWSIGARPYTEITVEDLKRGVSRETMLDILHKGLRQRGFNIKFK